jgi:UDP-N-acetylmuramoyl-tripeptide--D-alanyl-D-alanine ligase
LEIGADKPGDIEDIVGWVSPDIAVLTALADVPVHVENFDSDPKLVYKEKGKLLESLTKDGVAILNADDTRVMGMRSLTEAKIMTFGVNNQADITPTDIIMPRVSNPYAVLAGATVAKALGMDNEEIKKLSSEVRTPPGRMSELKGINNSLIIDDTYNSSPVALASALNTLNNLSTGSKKIVVLGDMMELGKFSEQEHRKIGASLIDIVDSLVVVGTRARWIFEEAKEKRTDISKLTDFKVCESSVDAGEYLKHIIKEGDIVLVKGSQSARMEKAIEQILQDPINDRKLLVRQDEEWKGR